MMGEVLKPEGMRTESEIRTEIARVEGELSHIKMDLNDKMWRMYNDRRWALKWVLRDKE